MKRLFKGKTPAPGFRSCSADGDDNGFELGRGVGAIMEGSPRFIREGFPCVEADHNGDANTPFGCVGTVEITKVFQYGEQIGETYYERVR